MTEKTVTTTEVATERKVRATPAPLGPSACDWAGRIHTWVRRAADTTFPAEARPYHLAPRQPLCDSVSPQAKERGVS